MRVLRQKKTPCGDAEGGLVFLLATRYGISFLKTTTSTDTSTDIFGASSSAIVRNDVFKVLP
ncbi:MAG: hypothetical protein AB8B48_12880 [Pseudomonadales bacterium]